MNYRVKIILALASGLLAGLVFDLTYSNVHNFSKGLLLLPATPFSVPGVIFGLFLALISGHIRKLRPVRIAGILLFSGAAYYCAVYISYLIFLEDPRSVPAQVLTGGLSGLAGSILLVLMARVIAGKTFSMKYLVLTAVAGSLLGCLFMGILIVMGELGIPQTWTPSFLIWQFPVLLFMDAGMEKGRQGGASP